jgi:hypothetical protein
MKKGFLAFLFLISCASEKARISALLPVQQAGGKYQFINRDGKMAIGPHFAEAGCFSDGLALVAVPGTQSRWGYIDQSGKFKVPAKYLEGTTFSEGVAFVVADNGAPVAIDNKGTPLFTATEAEKTESFREGLAAYSVSTESGERWGFMDKAGKTVITPQFFGVGYFSGDLCSVVSEEGKWGYINREGMIIISWQYENVSAFEGEMAKVLVKGKWGVIDKSGKYILPPQFDDLDIDGDKLLVKQNGKWGWRQPDGKELIAAQFDDAFGFKGKKYAPVSVGSRWGYVDEDGKVAIAPQFDFAFGFDGDMAPVGINNKYGFINKSGKYVIAPELDNISPDYFISFFANNSVYFGVKTHVNSPRHVAYAWLMNFYRMDYEAAKEISTDDTRQLLCAFSEMGSNMDESSKRELMKVNVGIKGSEEAGDKAIVTYVTSDNPGKKNKVYLLKEDGKWRVQFSKSDFADFEEGGGTI